MTKNTPQTPKLTPAMQQYMDVKESYPDAIVFFQMGDFYEMFFADAEIAAPLLNIALTSRSKHGDAPIPMCGVPLAAGISYANRLTEQGRRVVICRQVGEPQGKGIVQRQVWQVGTAGLPLSQDEGENGREPHYLAAVFPGEKILGLAGLDVSTGELILGRYEDYEALRAALLTFGPKECLVPSEVPTELASLLLEMQILTTSRTAENLLPHLAEEYLTELFGPEAVGEWSLNQEPEALAATAGVLAYAAYCGQGELRHLAPPRLLWNEAHLILDEAALANLEILKSLRHGQREGSLWGLMDAGATAMGGRLLRQWLSRPSREMHVISARHGAVEEFLRDGLRRDELISLLKKSTDLEKALGRLTLARGGPRDLASLGNTLALLPQFAKVLAELFASRLAKLADALPDFAELTKILTDSLEENPPLSVKDGGLIRRGVNPELDELLDLEKGGKVGIAALEAQEKAATGINSLKVGFNRVYGYYLEVSKSNLHLAPPQWIRKQTIAGGERFLTPELKELEAKILAAGERRLALEEKIFSELQALALAQAQEIKKAAAILAEVDVLTALATLAERFHWVRPQLTEDDRLEILGGRHPVVEAFLPAGQPFVANDVSLDQRERFLLITGPNMAGKSTILRQVALIVLMCQAGSFVPAEKAVLSIRDRIFTRVGAADDLTRGRSTFMVEMNETARILALATPRSLVVLDEVGRGTSTYDGLSLAWAIAEYLHDLGGRGVPTLFATHYHELLALAKTKGRVRNFHVEVRKEGERLLFKRKLKPGGVNRSYGLAVAALAGLPEKVLGRAKEILADFSNAGDRVIRPALWQRELFEPLYEEVETTEPPIPETPPLIHKLAELKPEELTPLAALNLLNELTIEAKKHLES